jgi:hypothetical protein
MKHEPRGPAATESYPTFWDDVPRRPAAAPVAPDEAYSAFVNLTEDDFPGAELPAASEPDAD